MNLKNSLSIVLIDFWMYYEVGELEFLLHVYFYIYVIC